MIVDVFSIRATILMTASIEDAIRALEIAIEDAEIVDVNKRNFVKEDVNLTFPVTKMPTLNRSVFLKGLRKAYKFAIINL